MDGYSQWCLVDIQSVELRWSVSDGYTQWCLVDIQSVELSGSVSGWLHSVVFG